MRCMVCMACQAPGQIYMTDFENMSCAGPYLRRGVACSEITDLKAVYRSVHGAQIVLQVGSEASLLRCFALTL